MSIVKGMSREERARFKLMAIELLRTTKENVTHRELSEMLGIAITVVSRYVKGHVLPNIERAEFIWNTLNQIAGLEKRLLSGIKFNEEGYFDNTNIIWDHSTLRLASLDALSRFTGSRITKVLTAAVDGIPLATMVANAINVPMVIARKSKKIGIKGLIEETYVPEKTDIIVSLYIPKGSINRKDSVLIVDDIIRNGETQKALINLVHKCKAEITGIYVLVGIGEECEKRLINLPQGCHFEAVVKIGPQEKS